MPQEIHGGSAGAPLIHESKDRGMEEEEGVATRWMVKPSRRRLNSRETMARIGKRETVARIGKRTGKASMMRIGKKNFPDNLTILPNLKMLPDNLKMLPYNLKMLPGWKMLPGDLSPVTIASRDEGGGNMEKRSWKTVQMWPNDPKLSRFIRFVREEGGKLEGGGGKIGKRIARRWSKGRSAFMRLGKRKKSKVEQKRDPENIVKRDFGFGGRRRCGEENFCNVEFNRNGVTFQIFYRHN